MLSIKLLVIGSIIELSVTLLWVGYTLFLAVWRHDWEREETATIGLHSSHDFSRPQQTDPRQWK